MQGFNLPWEGLKLSFLPPFGCQELQEKAPRGFGQGEKTFGQHFVRSGIDGLGMGNGGVYIDHVRGGVRWQG